MSGCYYYYCELRVVTLRVSLFRSNCVLYYNLPVRHTLTCASTVWDNKSFSSTLGICTLYPPLLMPTYNLFIQTAKHITVWDIFITSNVVVVMLNLVVTLYSGCSQSKKYSERFTTRSCHCVLCV